MRHWFRDQHFRSLLKNSSYLAASRIVAAIAQLVTVSLAAHALGVLLLGALILIDSYARAVSGIAKFQSWQVIVRYGSRVLHGEHEDFKASTGFAFALDVISGVGGMLVGIAVLPFVGRWVGIEPDQILLAMLYCTLLPTMASATPTGVLRALDRFDLISWADTVTPISRVIIVLVRLSLRWTVHCLSCRLVHQHADGRCLRPVHRCARASAARTHPGHPPHLEALDPAGCLALCNSRKPDLKRSGCLGPDRSAGGRRTPRACRSSAVSGCLILVRQRRQARRPPWRRPSTLRLCAWTLAARSRGS